MFWATTDHLIPSPDPLAFKQDSADIQISVLLIIIGLSASNPDGRGGTWYNLDPTGYKMASVSADGTQLWVTSFSSDLAYRSGFGTTNAGDNGLKIHWVKITSGEQENG